jgi:hypothetical protein
MLHPTTTTTTRLRRARRLLALLALPLALLLAGCDSGGSDDDGFFGVAFESTTLAVGDSLGGALESGDSRVSDYDEGIAGGDSVDPELDALTDVYRLRIDEDGARTIDLTSSDFDAALVLYRLDGTLLEVTSGGGLDARISRSLGAGTYALIATATRRGNRGDYALSVD